MHGTKILLPMAALAGVSLGQTTITDPACIASVSSLRDAAPTIPAILSPYFAGTLVPATGTETATATATATATTKLPPDTLQDPEGFVEALCSLAPELPSSALVQFQTWGSSLLRYGSAHMSEYDAFVTQCVTTGPAASSITSYLNSILTATGGLCKPTSTPASNGTVSATPTPTASSGSSSATSPVTAAAARATGGVLAGAAALGGIIGAAALL